MRFATSIPSRQPAPQARPAVPESTAAEPPRAAEPPQPWPPQEPPDDLDQRVRQVGEWQIGDW